MRSSLPTAPSVAALTARRYRVADAVANLGETEVREALLAKATFFVKLGDKARAERVLRRPCADHTVLCLRTGCCRGGVRRDGEQGTGAVRLRSRKRAYWAPPAADGCAWPEDGPCFQHHARALHVWRLSGN